MGGKENIELIVGGDDWSIRDIIHVANCNAHLILSDDEEWRQKVLSGAAYLEKQWKENKPVYGVTTGYGNSVGVAIPPELVEQLPLQLTRFHGCGLGEYLSKDAALAVMATRLKSLARGVSGVRIELLQTLTKLINHQVVPLIPQEGSVGASGDLTPLSYVAALLIGERQALYRSEIRPAQEVLEELGIEPLHLRPKEGLALMNGTSLMTALACQAYDRAEYLAQLASRATALTIEAIGGNKRQFDPRLHAVKPYPGQKQVAGWIARDIGSLSRSYQNEKLQDRYSLRCSPHVLGVLVDALPWVKNHIEIELNSANDNPIVLGDEEDVIHGGHFYGGHISFAMDSLKNAVANIADLLDRQLALFVDTITNNGLPSNLSGASEQRAPINHGFKAVQIGTSSWAAEALKLTMPASVFSRSTECHNQDKVSMGTHSSRDCLRVLECTEQVLAASLIAGAQGIYLREKSGELNVSTLSPELRSTFETISEIFPMLEDDRALEGELRAVIDLIRDKAFTLYQ